MDFKASPTVSRFMQSDHQSRWLVGPFGSGKSVGCMVEIVRRCLEQKKGSDGFRRSRWAIVRNTMPMLRDTTMKTWFTWFPNGSIGYYKETGKTYTISVGDVRAEIMFRALEDENDIRNLLSLELTAAYFNEFREIPYKIVEYTDARLRRYPSVDMGGSNFWGIIGDTNAPNIGTDWYYRLEGLDPDDEEHAPLPHGNGMEIFRQPPAVLPYKIGEPIDLDNLIRGKNTNYRLNPEAENLENLDPDYYQALCRGKDDDFIRVNAMGQYGRSKSGRPVHNLFNRDIHGSHVRLEPDPNLKLVLSADFGLTPAFVFKQQDAFGRVITLESVSTRNMGLERALRTRIKPLIARRYKGFDIHVTGDPAGNRRADSDEKTCKSIFKREGFLSIELAPSNSPLARINATDHFLGTLTEAGPAYLVDLRGCGVLVRGLEGAYHFKRTPKGEDTEEIDKKPFETHTVEANQYGDMYFFEGGDTKARARQRADTIAQLARMSSQYHTPRR